MFSQMAESGMAAHQQYSQSQFYFENQALQEVAEMSQTLQERLPESRLQQQQQNHPLPYYYKPPPPYPLHLLQSQCHEGFGQSNNGSEIANNDIDSLLLQFLNQQESLNRASSHDWQNWDPSHPLHYKPPPPYPHHLQPQGHESHWDPEQSNNGLPLHPQNEQLPSISTSPSLTVPPETDLLHNSQSAIDPPIDETKNLEEMEQFAQDFRKRRIKLGFTQRDVGNALKKLHANDFSPTTISRFEALKLSLKNMCNIKPFLEEWLEEANNLLTNPIVISKAPTKSELIGRKRRKRTKFETSLIAALERAFTLNPKPPYKELVALADNLGTERDVVRIWFCNRRAKEKRKNPPIELNSGSGSSLPPMYQHVMFTSSGEDQGSSGELLPRSSPPPYSAKHLVIH